MMEGMESAILDSIKRQLNSMGLWDEATHIEWAEVIFGVTGMMKEGMMAKGAVIGKGVPQETDGINGKSIHAGHKSDIRGLSKETEVGGSRVTRDIGKSLHELPSDKAFSTGVSVSEKLKLEKQTKVPMIGFAIILLLMLLTKRRKLVIAPLLLVARKGMMGGNMGAVFSDLK